MLCRGTDAWRMHSQYSTNILLLNQQNWADFCFQGLDSCATKDTRSSWFWQMVCRVPGGMLLLFIYTHLIWSDDHFKNPSTEFQKHFFFIFTYLCFQDTTWMEANLFDGDSSENRIPFDVLDSTEAETVYKNLLNQLNAEQNRFE